MFKTMKKEKTTEPEVELKLKKGGKAKMAMGGNPMIAPVEVMPARKRMAMKPRPMMSPMQEREAMMTRKKGGEVESPKMHKSEMKQMGKIEKELKSHENKPASKAHKGLKTGGVTKKFATGGVVQKFATGGTTSSKIANKFVNKMDDGSMPKNKVGKTGGMSMPGYKDGGHVAMTCKNEGGYTQMKKMSKC
jgi:hypothetical protein